MDYQEKKLYKDYKHALHFASKTHEELIDYAKNEQQIRFRNQVNRADCLIDSYLVNPAP